ncbi:hypothetical protein [Tumebacillus algifaecis]|uniref:hypothetical protein n=1 Tax=Tumebacillus algifaecis TaxID=1214604 RepID=UPI0012FE2BCE|nr:hypothetical protein [Tumebacillus algifaecis]
MSGGDLRTIGAVVTTRSNLRDVMLELTEHFVSYPAYQLELSFYLAEEVLTPEESALIIEEQTEREALLRQGEELDSRPCNAWHYVPQSSSMLRAGAVFDSAPTCRGEQACLV